MKTGVLALLILFAPLVWAQRSVGNGGGLAEMQVISYHLKLNLFLQACLVARSTCPLSSSDRENWQKMKEEHAEISKKYSVVFQPDLKGPVFEFNGSQLVFSSAALYLQGVPKKPAEILGFVIASRWSQLLPQVSIQQILAKTEVLTGSLSSQLDSFRILGGGSLVTIHSLAIDWGGQRNWFLLLEDPATTYDLSEKLNRALPCPLDSKSSLSGWRGAGSDREQYFVAHVGGSCAKTKFEGQIVVKLSLNPEGRVLIDSTTVLFTQKSSDIGMSLTDAL